MSKIRLNGTSSGYTELAPPAAAGSNTITLPSSNGSANQFLKNGSTAGTLGWSSMVETATGVGIGTTSPGANLHVSADAAAIRIGLTASDQYGQIYRDNATGFIAYNSAQASPFCGHAFLTSGTERARITSGGDLCVGSTGGSFISNTGSLFAPDGASYLTRSGANVVHINRLANDGDLVNFYQAGTGEGSISVSGTTVSYNGAHLSRWSQISSIDPHDKDARPEILRGTVMSNLDEMCDWIDPDSGEAQANEQLNKTKISDVEGDKNVAGVFQSWDDDDDTWVNDFYLAMTGDFVIRIAEGVTVERGDLLISAGDGTAKPQDDDLIRSSTVAKVTSTTVSHVHPDGSFCVPCVLMAC